MVIATSLWSLDRVARLRSGVCGHRSVLGVRASASDVVVLATEWTTCVDQLFHSQLRECAPFMLATLRE